MKNPRKWDELTEAQKQRVKQIADDELNMAIMLGDISEADVADLTADDYEVFEKEMITWYEADPDSFDL